MHVTRYKLQPLDEGFLFSSVQVWMMLAISVMCCADFRYGCGVLCRLQMCLWGAVQTSDVAVQLCNVTL
jgi:hypothetical protein